MVCSVCYAGNSSTFIAGTLASSKMRPIAQLSVPSMGLFWKISCLSCLSLGQSLMKWQKVSASSSHSLHNGSICISCTCSWYAKLLCPVIIGISVDSCDLASSKHNSRQGQRIGSFIYRASRQTGTNSILIRYGTREHNQKRRPALNTTRKMTS